MTDHPGMAYHGPDLRGIPRGSNAAGIPWGAAAALALLVFLLQACAAERARYRDQVDELIFELAVTDPADTQEVFDFATRHSYRLDLALEGLEEELIDLLEEQGPWYEKLLVAYLLALAEAPQGFEAMIDMIDDGDTPPEVREGLYFCGMKYLGFTERDSLTEVTGWEADLEMWEDALDRIEEAGLHVWRRELIRDTVLSGQPGGGDASLAASDWLSYTLDPSDLPFLKDLLGRGSPKCDLALLLTMERLLLRNFLPGDEAGGLEEGLNAFRAWYVESASKTPDAWMKEAFAGVGYEMDSFYGQASLPVLAAALLDDSEKQALIRGHALKALNRISGLHADRRLIFLEREERERAAKAFMAWYERLADRVRIE